MRNFKDEILKAAGDEHPLWIVIKSHRENDYNYMGERESTFKMYTWQEAAPILDYEYDNGYGGVSCHAIIAWTASKVIFVGCYDGSSWVESVPRHPTKVMPFTVGGG